MGTEVRAGDGGVVARGSGEGMGASGVAGGVPRQGCVPRQEWGCAAGIVATAGRRVGAAGRGGGGISSVSGGDSGRVVVNGNWCS